MPTTLHSAGLESIPYELHEDWVYVGSEQVRRQENTCQSGWKALRIWQKGGTAEEITGLRAMWEVGESGIGYWLLIGWMGSLDDMNFFTCVPEWMVMLLSERKTSAHYVHTYFIYTYINIDQSKRKQKLKIVS